MTVTGNAGYRYLLETIYGQKLMEKQISAEVRVFVDSELREHALPKAGEYKRNIPVEERANLVRLRFGLDDDSPKTFTEIAEIYGISHSLPSQLISKILRGLRRPRTAWPLRQLMIEDGLGLDPDEPIPGPKPYWYYYEGSS